MLDKSNLKSIQSDTSDKSFSEAEIAKFDKLAENWWDPKGKYKTALAFNEARVDYFIKQICLHYNRNPNSKRPLTGLTILDVGSGGGLVCEPLAKAGATVTGIDASEMSVEVAKRHAQKSRLNITYQHKTAKQAVASFDQVFDVVINAEVIEHVPEQKELVKQCTQLCKVGGCLIMATLNRTIKSYIVGIIGAEYIMRYLPIGTHSWSLFVKPYELNGMASLVRLKQVSEKGMSYNIFSKRWKTCKSMQVNYIQVYERMPSLYK